MVRNAEGQGLSNQQDSLGLLDVKKTERILVVDDNTEVRQFMSKSLALAGYEVIEASSGKEAMEFCRKDQTKIHILVADVVMSEISGWQIASQIVALRPEMKVLFVSGYPNLSCLLLDHDIPDESVKPEFDFIQKPFTRNGLLAKVHQVLGQNP